VRDAVTSRTAPALVTTLANAIIGLALERVSGDVDPMALRATTIDLRRRLDLAADAVVAPTLDEFVLAAARHLKEPQRGSAAV
jgi:hypothetical protein